MLYVTINKSQRPFRCRTTLLTGVDIVVLQEIQPIPIVRYYS